MREPDDLATIRALRGDVALQISRSICTRNLSQSAAARLLGVPHSTLVKIVNGSASGLSLDLLIRIAVRAHLSLVLQTGTVPAEAGAFVSGRVQALRVGARSRVVERSRDELLTAARAMTPEQRLNVQLEHSELLAELQAGASASQK